MTQHPLLSITFYSSLGFGWTLLGAIILLVFSLWSYRWTRPPIPRGAKLSLAILRALALIAVWCLTNGLEIRWLHEMPRQSRITLLIDRSKSMSFQDRSSKREETVKSILANPILKELRANFQVEPFIFSDEIKPLKDLRSIPPASGSSTDLSTAFGSLLKDPRGAPDAVILLSDGAVNQGDSPTEAARILDAPVFTIAVGDSLAVPDLVVSDILAPEATYVGEPLSLDVTLRATGVKGAATVVKVVDSDNRTMAQDTVNFSENWEEKALQFTVKPDRVGIVAWRVEAQSVVSEINTANNSRQIALHVAERRRNVLLLSGSASKDAATLAKTLESDRDTTPFIVIGGGPQGKLLRGKQFTPDKLSELDAAIVFLGNRFGSMEQELARQLASSTIPLILISGDQPDRTALSILASRINRTKRVQMVPQAVIQPAGFHPIFTQSGTWFEEGQTNAPPLNLPDLEPEGGQVIAVAHVAGEDRHVFTSPSSNPRTLLIFAEGLWRWDQVRRPFDPSGNGYRNLWDRILRWMTSEEESQRISLSPVKSLFTGGEMAELTVQIRDESRRPIDDASVSAQVTHADVIRTIEFSSLGSGLYMAKFPSWGEGSYKVSAEIEAQTQSFKRTTDFIVDAFHLEDAELRMRPDRLRAIAAASGGAFLTPHSISELPSLLPKQSGTELRPGAWRPFGLAVTLILTVTLLAVEWFVRTRCGMV